MAKYPWATGNSVSADEMNEAIAESRAFVNVKHHGATGDGTTNDTAAIDEAIGALPANGGRLYFPAGRYIRNTTIRFSKPVQVFGDGAGIPTGVGVTAGVPTTIKFPLGVHGFVFDPDTGTGQQGAAHSSLRDLVIEGSWSTASGVDNFDGLRLQSYAFLAENVVIFGFGRDGVNVDTNAASNANMSTLINVSTWQTGRHGFYFVGTNSNVITTITCQANNAEQYGIYSGGPATPNNAENPGGGNANVHISFHSSFNKLGAFYDNTASTTYIAPYCEDTRTTYANSWRGVFSPESHSGTFIGIAWGGFPLVFESPHTAANTSWDIRNPDTFLPDAASAGVRPITGSKGGNAALASLISGFVAAGRALDQTT